ncbi:YggS family pyridoxal phosphate-dependent enzyme [Xenorhabdus sp. SF857]|uniref:YggS family pyridoxal phosphate-dependent enzyme n=1 Tax=Xenorhabdus bakwenae TaxID=3026967 RepID=UPI002557DEF4|nr:YggS family pyridoxal phosphate-dependent enzyme [Xenorhabdus sp. SF857]WFQ80065.1 YggS family pyridoxal phosphate-dependent enzyme [Xenorhabdus sp. SF857]
MNNIEQNLHDVRNRMTLAAQKCGRSPEEITLLAVSKTKPVDAIAEAIANGQREFGENYVQEGVEKIQHFNKRDDLVWHFIGPLQSNKSRLVAENFDWCHTVDRVKIAQRLSEQRPENRPPLNILIQINISGEESKSGILLEELTELAATINGLPNMVLRGLMAIPAPANNFKHQIAVFHQMEHAFIGLKAKYPHVDTLSMGMTDDMEAAITCGSTLVRIGTAIFGVRQYKS